MKTSNTTTKEPLFFLSPVPTETDEIEFEWHQENGISGLLIDKLDENGETLECHFLQAWKSDVEEWIFDNGTEDEDYSYEGEWDDSEGEKGGTVNKKYINEENYRDNLRAFVLAHRNQWTQHS